MDAGKKIITLTAEELLNVDFPIREAIIPDLLNVGCYLLVGSPKIGKSYLALQIGMHVSQGIPLWDIPLQQSNVFYLALEDSFERLHKRYAQMSNYENNKHIMFAVESPKITNGLSSFIKDVHNSFNFRLLTIDTLQMIRSDNPITSYKGDYNEVSVLRDLAYELNISVLLIHHTRKMVADDEFDMIAGTNGIFASADGAFILKKNKRIDKEAKLICTGRDIAYSERVLSFDSHRFMWDCKKFITDDNDLLKDKFLEKINALVNKYSGNWIGTPTQLYNEINDTNLPVNKLTMKLKHHVDDLRKIYNIVFEYKLLKQKTIILKYINNNVGEKDND